MENTHIKTEEIIKQAALESYKVVAMRGVVAFPGEILILDIARDKSMYAIEKALQEDAEVFLASQRDPKLIALTTNNINSVGCFARIKQFVRMPNDTVRVSFLVLEKGSIERYTLISPHYEAIILRQETQRARASVITAYASLISAQFELYKKASNRMFNDIDAALRLEDSQKIISAIGSQVYKNDSLKQRLLELSTEEAQLENILDYLTRETEIVTLEKKIAQQVRKNLDKNQRDFYLREQVKVIHEELGDNANEFEEYRERAKKMKMPKATLEKVLKEIVKLEKANPTSPESAVSRNYIEWILDMPWNKYTKETKDLKKARKILDEDHYGIEKVKERIVEYLAVNLLNDAISGPILCFVGPPGVGKTSVVSSIARASGREFVSMSLGGVRDEAEIRGHRRTYIGALPGRIINGIKNAKTANPVFLLDEIDKMTADFRGDPSSALLEVLDSNQNHKFKDHYLEVEFDLSRVMFVTTANSLDTIPLPLKDRMEIIELSGYTHEEKLEIAKRYLVKKQLKANGLDEKAVVIPDKIILDIISLYTRESGVRSLERQIATVCRKVAVMVVNSEIKKGESLEITKKHIESFLGVAKYKKDKLEAKDEIGIATGLAYTSVGGVTLPIEVSLLPGGKGEITLTGSLGDVMKESCKAALSLVKSRADKFNIAVEKFSKNDVHIHFPEGATPKDGPSAGIAIATALLSAFSNRKVLSSVAMTGEVTLRGKVLAIGGLKEKSLAAFRSGIKKIIIPQENEKDVKELPKEVSKHLEIVYAQTIDTVFSNSIL